jgi:hypothetical protein
LWTTCAPHTTFTPPLPPTRRFVSPAGPAHDAIHCP